MMALEALLPSEIARLIYGYLLDERCTETAQLFLNESTNLHECRSVLSRGKTFTTRVNGHTLKNILDNFCAVNSIVQDKVSQLDNLDELNHCYDLVEQIRFLLEDCTKQTNVVKVDASTQITPTKPSESPGQSRKTCSCLSINKERPTQRVIQRFHKEVQTETPFYDPSAVEATLLKNLPGYIGHSENGKCHNKRTKVETQKVNLHEEQNEEIIPKSSKQYVNSAVQTSVIEKGERLDKNVMTDIVEKPFNNCIETKVQTSEFGSPDSGIPPSSVELLGDITLELLNRTEIQERIAENINRILESKKSVYFSNEPTEATKEKSSKSFIAELNKTVQTAFNKTENDPDILDLLNEIIQPGDDVLSTEDEADMEVDNIDEFQENMDLDFGKAMSELKNNKETVLVQNGQSPAKILREQNVSDGIYNSANAENNPTQVGFGPKHSTKSISNQVLLENRQSKTKLLGEQNISDGTYNTQSTENNTRQQNVRNETYTTTSAHSNTITPTQVEFDPAHSTKFITDQAVVEHINNKECSEVSSNIQNNSETIVSSSLSYAESPALQQKPVPTSDNFFTHNNTITSTPLKTCTAVQGFDPCDWFSTEALSTPDISFHKDSASLFKNPYTACETVVTTTSLISPIASKDTSNIAEKVTVINCTTANALKNRTLNTPDVTFPPKSNFPSITNPVFPKNLPLNKDSEIQISSEVKNDLPSSHSTQKVNGIADNNNSLSLSNEKLFGSESIMLYGMENNATTVPTIVTIPEIEVEDSITLTGTGLSPFIKINKKSKDIKSEKTDPVSYVNNVVLNGSPNEPIAVTEKNQEFPESVLKLNACTTEVVTKGTPKILKENRPKSNRLSLSTPKKPSSHVRALNFETPVPRSQSESKANDKTTVRSPESIMKELKNACKSSLFQSPEITNLEIIQQNDLPTENGVENVIPKNVKEEKIVSHNKATKQVVAPNQSVSRKPAATMVEGVKKKSWDEDLRTMLGQSSEPQQVLSKKSKKKNKPKDSEKSDSKKSKKGDKSTLKKLKNDDGSTPKESKKRDKKTPKKSKKSEKKTPKKSKKSDKSEASSDEKKVSSEETKIDIKKAEEMIMLSNSLEEMPVVPNSSEKIPIVPNSSDETPMESKSSEEMLVHTNSSKEMPMLPNSSEVMPIIPNSPEDKTVKTKHGGILSNSSLEALLSNSINDDEATGTTDVMKLAAEEMDNFSKLSHNESVSNIVADTNHDIVEKMQHDEELMSAALEHPTENVSSNFFVEQEIEPINHKKVKPEDVKNFVDYKKLDTQLNIEELNTTPPFTNNSIITTISSGSSQKAEVIYDRVSKIERGRIVQKKYARLHTLDTKIASKSGLNSSKTEIKTPHQDEETSSLQVPPTPRVLSPGNSCSFLTMPSSKLGDESRKIRSFVTTPVECPLTPEIVLTPPKTQDENTAEALKNLQKAGTSSYFHQSFTTFEALKTSEITQFEVIKENLKGSTPKTQFESEKTITDAPKNQSIFANASNDNPKPLSEIETIPRHQQRTISSSSCSSSSCSCSSSETSAAETCTNNNNDDEDHNDNNGPAAPSDNLPINIDEPKTRFENSPAKVFSIQKTDKELADTIQETPAKDENACPEMGIVDTPNVSKPAENPTNLNAKISQMMIMKEKEQMEKQQVTDKSKPKIISVEHVLPRIITKPPSQFIRALPLSMQRQAYEIQNESLNRNSLLQRVKIEKTEEEVAQAVESITGKSDFKFNKSITLSPVEKSINKPDLDNTPHKIELVKAVQSITNGEIDSPVYSPIKKVVSDDDEETSSIQSNNSKFEHCISSDHSKDSFTSESEQKVSNNSSKWNDLNATCREIHMELNDPRKRRRRKVKEEDLVKDYCLDNGHVLHYHQLRPTTFECLYDLKPPTVRKQKAAPAKSQFAYFKTDSQESTSATSSTVFSHLSHSEKDEEKQNPKRKRTVEPQQRTIYSKRVKNLNFNQF